MSVATTMCPDCAAAAARQAAHDMAYDFKHNRAIPEAARTEFEEKFGAVIVQMADWAAEYAEDWTLRQDHETCEEHRRSGEDES
jgi:hypothetical protein